MGTQQMFKEILAQFVPLITLIVALSCVPLAVKVVQGVAMFFKDHEKYDEGEPLSQTDFERNVFYGTRHPKSHATPKPEGNTLWHSLWRSIVGGR